MQFLSKTSIHTSGKGLYPIYRIPGLIVTAKGTIITYCEGRTGRSDWSAGAVVSRRSGDEGASWSDEICLSEAPAGESVNNPVMISGKDGKVFFLWQICYRRTFFQVSCDDGMTFSDPIEITPVFEAYRTLHKMEWNVYALGPGHGIELSDGRLIVPVWISYGKGNEHGPACVSTIYSDDSGATWKAGEIVPWDEGCPNMNETAAVELSDGRVMLNIRNHSKEFLRATSISSDGYSRFSSYHLEEALPDPICFGSMVKGFFDGAYGVLFCNCDVLPCKENFYSTERKNLTVKLSLDNGNTWKTSRLLELRSGYSDISVSNNGNWIYCFYEHDCSDIIHTEPRHLTFAKFNLEWLKN